MGPLRESLRQAAGKLGAGGVAALATGAVLVAGVTAVGAVNGADDTPSASPVTISMPLDDDGTPDQGSGDAPGTPGGPGDDSSTTVPTVPSTTTPTVPSTTVAPPAPPTGGTRTIPVPGVGEVVITEGAALGLVSATPAPGFTVRTESSAREIHVRFFDAAGGRIDVQVQIEDGATRVRIRDRRLEDRDDDRDRSGRDDDARPGVTVPPSAPPSTIDDNGGDRDRDRDDRGRGRGGDDDRGRDDRDRDRDRDDDRDDRDDRDED